MQNNTFSTLFVGQNLIRLSEVDSTNNFLKMMVSNSEPLTEGTVIMADRQYAGRGQQGAVWLSEPGKNLTISIYLAPKFLPVERQFYLNMAVSNAILSAVNMILDNGAKIKWPNDIYYQDRKLGGILIENIVSAGRLKSSIVGLGLNVNQKDFDNSINNLATSIATILHGDVNLVKLLEDVCSHIEKEYLVLKSAKETLIKTRYLNNLYRFGKLGRYRQNGEEVIGEIVDVMDGGRLVLEIDGKITTYDFKEIEFVMNN